MRHLTLFLILFFSITTYSETELTIKYVINKEAAFQEFEDTLRQKIYKMMDKVDREISRDTLITSFEIAEIIKDEKTLELLETYPKIKEILQFYSSINNAELLRGFITKTTRRNYLTTKVLERLRDKEGYRIGDVRDSYMFADGSFVFMKEDKITYNFSPEARYEFICHPTIDGLCAKVTESKTGNSSEVIVEKYEPKDWNSFRFLVD